MADNYNDALKFAKENGWTNIKVGDKWEDYCPDCQENQRQNLCFIEKVGENYKRSIIQSESNKPR